MQKTHNKSLRKGRDCRSGINQNKDPLVLSYSEHRWHHIQLKRFLRVRNRPQKSLMNSFLYAKSILKELPTPCYVEKEIKTNIQIDASEKGK